MRVRLVDVTKKFVSLRGEVFAVNRINLEIKDGEFFVLLGPSGGGKSTLLNLVAGLEKLSAGEIWFDEKLVNSAKGGVFLTPKERNVAFVFQSYALYPHLNVFENIAFPLRIRGGQKITIKQSVEKAANTLKISDLLFAKPKELSGGQRQRVAIARAIVRQPSLFLLDEPLSNLDPQLRLSTRRELKELQHKLGITTVYVTHDQLEAMSIGDRIAIIRDGGLVQVGTPDELYEKPKNPFVATFIGAPGMNLIETSVQEENGIYWIRLGNKRISLPQNRKNDFEKFVSKTCILGIRPEHIKINPFQTEQSFRARIKSIESLGRDELVQVSIDDVDILVLTNEPGLEKDEVVDIEFDLSKLQIFNK